MYVRGKFRLARAGDATVTVARLSAPSGSLIGREVPPPLGQDASPIAAGSRSPGSANDLKFPGECILTYMEFQLDSAEYCQAQHK